MKFHENYPEQSPQITIIDSGNVDDTSIFDNEIQKIVRMNNRMTMIDDAFLLSSVKKI